MRSKIMVVEDERAARESLSFLLLANGYNVVTASNGLEAFKELEKFDDICSELDLIILDLRMPIMSGAEFLKRAQDITSAPPVIVMSGCVEDYDLAKNSGIKPAAVLGKPFSEEKLMEVIQNTISEHEHCQR